MSNYTGIAIGYLFGMWEENRNIKNEEKRELQKQKALEDNDIRFYFELEGLDIDSKKTEKQFKEYEASDGTRERWINCIKAKKMSRDELYDKGYSPAFLNYIRKVSISELEGWINEGDFFLGLYKNWKKNVNKYLLAQKQKVIEEKEKEAEERKEMNDRMSPWTMVFMFLAGILLVSAVASGIH